MCLTVHGSGNEMGCKADKVGLLIIERKNTLRQLQIPSGAERNKHSATTGSAVPCVFRILYGEADCACEQGADDEGSLELYCLEWQEQSTQVKTLHFKILIVRSKIHVC